jgi:hypothetical protein
VLGAPPPLISKRSADEPSGAHSRDPLAHAGYLLLSPVPRCRRGILALVVRGFRFWDNMASVSAPG